MLSSIDRLAEALSPKADEVLHCFFSPHRAPKGHYTKLPRGFDFIVPRTKEKFDVGSVKVAFWITCGEKMVADSKCGTFFWPDGYAQIADDSWSSPEFFAKEMSAHLRDKAPVSFFWGGPEDIVQKQILPLLN